MKIESTMKKVKLSDIPEGGVFKATLKQFCIRGPLKDSGYIAVTQLDSGEQDGLEPSYEVIPYPNAELYPNGV